MLNFCTNCGHQNKTEHQVCVECGASVMAGSLQTAPKAAAPAAKSKKPIPVKTKIITCLAAILIASFVGLYSWGTKAASADSAEANFFAALQTGDAKALTKVVTLSNANGRSISEKEAEAFIAMYSDITPLELESMTTIEKNGKLAGVIDTHKIVLTPQKIAIPFSFEGLELTLNGETVAGKADQDGNMVFSDIAPGVFDAKISYKGEYTEFTRDFSIWVEQQLDSSYLIYVQEDLPIDFVEIYVPFAEDYSSEEVKVFVGDKEVPVDEYGDTEKIGPLPLDGSIMARVEVEQPWGAIESNSIPITNNYMHIEELNVPEKLKSELGERMLKFEEELLQVSSTGDPSIFTTVAPEYLERFEEHTEDDDTGEEFQDHDSRVMSSLIEVVYDNDTFYLSEDGKRIKFDVKTSSNISYQDKDGKVLEEDTFENYSTLEFIYDEDTSSWYMYDYIGIGSVDFHSPVSLEGSGTEWKLRWEI